MSSTGDDGIRLSVICYVSQQSCSDCFQCSRRFEVSGFRPWSQIRWSQLFVSCPGGPSIVRSPSFQMSWEAEFCERCCRVTSLASLMKLKSRVFLHSALRTASCRIRVSFFSAVYFAVLSCETGRLSCLCVKYCNINIFRADCFLFDKWLPLWALGPL